jgi:uncharacterized membrane protein
MKLNVKQRNWLLSLHIAFGGLWFGTALCSIALILSFRSLDSSSALHGINLARNLLGELVIVPSAILSVITGALLCAFTNWGFFKQYWVMVKQVATLILIVVGSIWLGPWTKEMTAISGAVPSQALQDSQYLALQENVAIGGALQTVALLSIIVISTVKPWSRRNTDRKTN